MAQLLRRGVPGDGGDKLFAVARQLGLPDAMQLRELAQGHWTALDHFPQRGVVKHYVGRQAVLVRQPFAQSLEGIEQGMAFGR